MTEISARVRSSVRKSILVLALLTLAMAAPSYAGGLPGQCVSCPQCPPCGGGGGGGGGGGRGIPLLVCIFAPHLCRGWSDETPKPQAKRRPKYPEAFSRFDRLTEEVRDNLSDLVIPHDQDAITGVQGLHETLVRTDPEATAEVNNPSRGLVAGTGTAFFGPPGGGDDRFLPNPPELDLKVPTARSPGVADSARRLQYAIAILNKARNTKDLSADDQRFLIDQAAQMMSGQPVQLYLSDLKDG